MWRKSAGLAAEGRLPFVQPLSLTPFDSSPSRGASGETVHFAGTAKASPTRSNGDDRRQWRKQGGAVGAAASRMRAAAKQTLGAATRAVSPEVTERALFCHFHVNLSKVYKKKHQNSANRLLPILN